MSTTNNSGKSKIRKVAILFAGGPAPAANAVISTAAVSFIRHGMGVVGIRHGYSKLEKYSPDKPLIAGEASLVPVSYTHLTLPTKAEV